MIQKMISLHECKRLYAVLFFSLLVVLLSLNVQASALLRRPISPASPMWLIHIDTWNYPDPQKIINLIPADIRPYVVMNISLSVSHDTLSRFRIAEYGYETAKSWIRTCAENRMWAMIQPASGGMHRFSETDLSVYEEFFSEYPNFLGFNFAEQYWGFDDADPVSAKWTDRMALFSNLLQLSNKYGGYLVVSWCGTLYSPSINPIGMLKRNAAFVSACQQYSPNFILCEKYTSASYKFDMESLCLGAYLSGYSGQYGIRYDNSGWSDASGNIANFTLSSGSAPFLEHVMLTGQTVVDGPEIIYRNCFKEISATTTADGFTKRNWATFPHFDNVSVDNFRKILDGTVRIPTRKEVIDRTKVVIVNNVSSGTNDSIYSSPRTLFNGLYLMDNDGTYQTNKSFFKKSGRYPTIPTVFNLYGTDAKSFQVQINKSDYITRWPGISAKVAELNNYFPKEYTGDLYVGRHQNGRVTYNPYKTVQSAKATIPFKYNTCDSMSLAYSQYTAGVVKEYANQVTFYLSNFDDEVITGLKGDTIKIFGCTIEPTWSFVERGTHNVVPEITKSWSNGVFTLYVSHNGPLDITVNCSGSATGRLTSYTNAALIAPELPALYTGPFQYEAECFDKKNTTSLVKNGYSGSIRNYTGQGYIVFGTSSSAAVRDTVNMPKEGVYNLQIRYSALGDVTTTDIYVNGVKVVKPTFKNTGNESVWGIYSQSVTLNAGTNVIMLKANATGSYNINFDNIVLSPYSISATYDFSDDIASTNAQSPPALNAAIGQGNSATAGVVTYTDATSKTSNMLKPYVVGNRNSTGVIDLNLFHKNNANYSVTWKECVGSSTSDYKMGVLLRGDTIKANIGSATTGYVQGGMPGYVFIAYTANAGTTKHSEFRIYKSTTTYNTLSLLVNTSVTGLVVTAAQPVWYRATVSGSSPVTLKLEYSTDSLNWSLGALASETTATYNSGATQFLWGLGVANLNFYIDNITLSTIVDTTDTALLSPVYYSKTEVVSTEYYTVTGINIGTEIQSLSGLYIVRKLMSDGTIKSDKIFLNNNK